MMRRIARLPLVRHFTRLRARQDGVTAVEFAFVAPMLVLVLLVMFDFAHRMYLEAIVEGTLHRAARRATVGNQTATQIDDYVRSQLINFQRTATVTIDKSNFYQFSGVGQPEKITSDTVPLGSYNTGDCYEDLNGNGVYDTNAGRTGLGGSDDIVYYKVTMTFPRIVFLGKFLGWSDTESVSSNMVLRNQPYASQIIPTVRCS